MGLSYSENDVTSVCEIVVDGKVTREDYERVVPKVQAFIDRNGTIGVVEVIRDFDGFDPSILLPGLKFDLKNLSHVSHVAVVTDKAWMSPLVKAAAAVTPINMRIFPLSELEAAREWVAADLAALV